MSSTYIVIVNNVYIVNLLDVRQPYLDLPLAS
jgi:hypothetical protein